MLISASAAPFDINETLTLVSYISFILFSLIAMRKKKTQLLLWANTTTTDKGFFEWICCVVVSRYDTMNRITTNKQTTKWTNLSYRRVSNNIYLRTIEVFQLSSAHPHGTRYHGNVVLPGISAIATYRKMIIVGMGAEMDILWKKKTENDSSYAIIKLVIFAMIWKQCGEWWHLCSDNGKPFLRGIIRSMNGESSTRPFLRKYTYSTRLSAMAPPLYRMHTLIFLLFVVFSVPLISSASQRWSVLIFSPSHISPSQRVMRHENIKW